MLSIRYQISDVLKYDVIIDAEYADNVFRLCLSDDMAIPYTHINRVRYQHLSKADPSLILDPKLKVNCLQGVR